jgi:hypothetical protein
MNRLAFFLFALAMGATGIARADIDRPGELAANLASQWRLTDDAVLVADAQTKKPLLCLAAVDETGDTAITERQAELSCKAKVARWLDGEHWVRITGLAQRWSGDTKNQLLVLYAFATADGPSDEEVARWLTLALGKNTAVPPASIEVHRGLTGEEP